MVALVWVLLPGTVTATFDNVHPEGRFGDVQLHWGWPQMEGVGRAKLVPQPVVSVWFGAGIEADSATDLCPSTITQPTYSATCASVALKPGAEQEVD